MAESKLSHLNEFQLVQCVEVFHQLRSPCHLKQHLHQPQLHYQDNDLKVYKAIMILFESKDDIEIFNKKAIYLYLREITDLNTKQIVNSLKKFRKRYSNFKEEWDTGQL